MTTEDPIPATAVINHPTAGRIAATLTLAIIESILFSGISFGAASFTQVLQARQVYHHLCNSINTSTANITDQVMTTTAVAPLSQCDKVQDQMTLAFTIAQVLTPFGSMVSGFVLDKFGYRILKFIAAVLFGAGAACLTFVQPGYDWLIFPGFVLLGCSAIQILICNFQLPPMVRGFPFLLTAVISGCFDSSTMVLSTLAIISNTGINSTAVFGVYTVLGVICILSTIAIFPGIFNLLTGTGDVPSHTTEHHTKSVVYEAKLDESSEENLEIVWPSLKQQLLSTEFVLMLVWMTVNQLRFLFFLACHNDYVATIVTDSDEVNRYANIMNYVLVSALVLAFIPGLINDSLKKCCLLLRSKTIRNFRLTAVATLTITPILGIISCVLMYFKSTSILIPLYVFIAAHRAFLFATFGSFCISVFDPKHFGFIYASILLVAAGFQFLSVPFTAWVKTANSADQVNFLLLALLALSIVHPIVLLVKNWPRNSDKKEIEITRF